MARRSAPINTVSAGIGTDTDGDAPARDSNATLTGVAGLARPDGPEGREARQRPAERLRRQLAISQSSASSRMPCSSAAEMPMKGRAGIVTVWAGIVTSVTSLATDLAAKRRPI